MGRRRKLNSKNKNKNQYTYIPPKIEYIYNNLYNLKIENSLIKNGGLGVFTLENIPKNALLGEYIGEFKHNNDTTLNSSYSLNLESDHYIDAFEYPRTIFAMINDCRFSNYDYNCTFKVYQHKAEIWSITDIPSNTELYINYGDAYWKYR
tara:strand:+ start:1058 stop:1507 length:450 start_codon:yes stop_codon:yes gene_type:complete